MLRRNILRDFLRFRFYMELLSISLGITLWIWIIPMQIMQNGQPRIMTVGLGMILWYTIYSYNETFHELKNKWKEKWFEKK